MPRKVLCGAMASLTRQELYDLVWSEAVSRVAKRFSLSGAGLRKLRLRNDIPLPPRGHWAKIAAGKKTKRVRLPKPDEADVIVHIREGNERSAPKPKRSFDRVPLVAQRRSFEIRSANQIGMRDEARQTHPWARELKRCLRASEPNYRGLKEAHASDHLVRVEVSESIIGRAVGIVDALGRAITKRRFELVEVPSNVGYGNVHHRGTRFIVEGIHMRIRLVEKTTRTKKPRRSRTRAASFWEREHKYDYKPTGTLRLTVIGDDYGWFAIERVLQDKANEPLEEQLNEVMVAATESRRRLGSGAWIGKRRVPSGKKNRPVGRRWRAAARRKLRGCGPSRSLLRGAGGL